MMSAIVPLWAFGSCKRLYAPFSSKGLTSSHFCAGGLGSDTCQGDSGGALQCPINFEHESYKRCNGYFVRGITSFGYGCNKIGYPGVYVDLSRKGILLWIEDWKKIIARKCKKGLIACLNVGKTFNIQKENENKYSSNKGWYEDGW